MNHQRLRLWAPTLLLLAAAACGGPQRSQPEQCPTATTTAAIADTMVIRAEPSRAIMGRHLQVWVRMPAQRPDLKDLQLFVDGHPVPGLAVRQIGARCALRNGNTVLGFVETYEFMPVRNAESRETWAHLLGSPDSYIDTVRVGAGLPKGPEFKTNPVRDSTEVAFTVVDRNMFGVVSLVFAALLVALVWAGVKTTILRDATPIEPPGRRGQEENPASVIDGRDPEAEPTPPPPYSLARVMMAMWTFLILTGYFGIWLITGDHLGIFTTQALLLLGITGVSTAASVAITEQQHQPLATDARELRLQGEALRRAVRVRADQLRTSSALDSDIESAPEIVALKRDIALVENARQDLRAEAPGSKSFFIDLISDANGPALYRFQNLLWNVALAIVFIVGTYRALAFPHFDDALMALLGISEALYLGVKITSPLKTAAGANQKTSQSMSARVKRVIGSLTSEGAGTGERTGRGR